MVSFAPLNPTIQCLMSLLTNLTVKVSLWFFCTCSISFCSLLAILLSISNLKISFIKSTIIIISFCALETSIDSLTQNPARSSQKSHPIEYSFVSWNLISLKIDSVSWRLPDSWSQSHRSKFRKFVHQFQYSTQSQTFIVWRGNWFSERLWIW